MYNIVHPYRNKIIANYLAKQKPPPLKGIGVSKEELLLPLSVEGQAQRLIDEATARENLVQLFIGWQAWL